MLRASTLALSALWLFVAGEAWPAMSPHRHDNLAITWEGDGNKGGAMSVVHPNNPAAGGAANPQAGNSRHQHYDDKALVYGTPSNEPFSVAGVWVNRTNYNFISSVLLPNGQPAKFAVAGYPDVAHGFIDEANTDNIPRYRFVGANWNDGDPKTETSAEKAQPLVVKAFETWSALQAMNSPVSKLPLVTGLEFRHVAPDAAAEIDVFWGGTQAKGVFERQIDDKGVTTSARLRFNDSIKFAFGKPEETKDDETFFYTVALHEVGHVVGLDHQDTVFAGLSSLMFTAQREGKAGARDTIDAGSIGGALALYSVPVPEPAITWLLLPGVAAVLMRARRATTHRSA